MILYNNIFPEGIPLKDVLVEENKVKFINIGNTLVYDTFSHIEYGTPTLTISYPVMDRGGCSGTLTVSPTITYTLPATTYGYSGKSYDTIILTGNVTNFTASGKELNSSGAWIDNNTGEVYRESLNTTYKSSEWSIMEVTITAIINGISISKKAIVRMQSNTYTDTPTTITYGDIIVPPIVNGMIPASGGIATAKAENAKQSYIVKAGTRTYQTGCLETIGQSSNGERIIYPDYSLILSSAESRGTSISDLTVIRSLKVTWEGYGDKIVEDTMYIYLEANYVTSVDIVDDLFLYTEKASANGGEITPITHQEVKLTFTSGDSVTTSDSSYPGGSITYNRDLSVMNWGGASHFIPDSGLLLFLDLEDNIKNERSTEVQSILTVTFTHLSTQGGSILGFSTKYAECYLEGNYIINIDVHIDSEFLYPVCGLNGGIVTPQNVNYSATYYYSSGTSSNDTPHTNYGSLLILTEYTLSGTGMASIDSSTGKLIWEPNTSTSSLVGIITLGVTYIWTHNNDYGSTSVTGYNSRTTTASCDGSPAEYKGIKEVVFECDQSLITDLVQTVDDGIQSSTLYIGKYKPTVNTGDEQCYGVDYNMDFDASQSDWYVNLPIFTPSLGKCDKIGDYYKIAWLPGLYSRTNSEVSIDLYFPEVYTVGENAFGYPLAFDIEYTSPASSYYGKILRVENMLRNYNNSVTGYGYVVIGGGYVSDVSKGVDITFVIPVDYYGTITHEDSNTGQITIEGAWYVLKEDSGMVSKTADELIYPITAYAVWETAWNTYSLDSMYNYMY